MWLNASAYCVRRGALQAGSRFWNAPQARIAWNAGLISSRSFSSELMLTFAKALKELVDVTGIEPAPAPSDHPTAPCCRNEAISSADKDSN